MATERIYDFEPLNVFTLPSIPAARLFPPALALAEALLERLPLILRSAHELLETVLSGRDAAHGIVSLLSLGGLSDKLIVRVFRFRGVVDDLGRGIAVVAIATGSGGIVPSK